MTALVTTPHVPEQAPGPAPAGATSTREIVVDGGLPGFPGSQRFALVEALDAPPLLRLHSLDEPDLEFVVAPPAVFFPDYAPELDDAAATRLGLRTADDALLLVVLTIPDDVSATTANLLAPVVVNRHDGRAAQVVVAGDGQLRAPLRGR